MFGMYSPSGFSLLFLIFFLPIVVCGGGAVFEVKRKFAGKDNTPIDELLKHDAHHHARLLRAKGIDVPLGGNYLTHYLYYTEVAIGTPPRNFTLSVDTGSDVMWVDCAPCHGCTSIKQIRERVIFYDPKNSKTARTIKCGESLCKTLLDDQRRGGEFPCKEVGEEFRSNPHDAPCKFIKKYGDETGIGGTYVTDLVSFNQVSGDHKTKPASASITFGCASEQDVDDRDKALNIVRGVDGLIGFAQTRSSIMSQLVSSGKASKMFAHCLNSKEGGGVFAIGHVAKPKVRTTPLVPNVPYHYHVNLKSIQVGKEFVQLPTGFLDATSDNPNSGTILDTGSTLTYVPPVIYKPLAEKIFSNHPNLKVNTSGGPIAFKYPESFEDFPIVTLHFEGSLTMEIKPEEYIIEPEKGMALFGFMVKKGFGDMLSLGDNVLTNKLFVFDLKKQTVGWTNYNCSSGIEIKDAKSGDLYNVDEHDIPASNAFCEESERSPSPSPSPSY